ncbi:MAG: hypothetical protein DLM61_03010 [Pseudonocardiales bacterium]|nr:DUF1059 domain-containing protein [Pseudonocardiales bacterium]PZS34750.1 MAG: hypothetical protein DLM61_03010 [Pseudonocardiales bacterium]
MYEFNCGHQECGSQLASSDKDVLMRDVVAHLKESHNIQTATQTLVSYLEATCVRTRTDR